MAAPKLSDTIIIDDKIDKELIRKWNTAIHDIEKNKKYKEIVIEPNIGRRYTFSFYGLLLFLGIEYKYHYPHLLINGYLSPLDYDGTDYDIKIIDLGILENYYKAFLK